MTRKIICSTLCALTFGSANGLAESSPYGWTTIQASHALGGLPVTGRVVPRDGALTIESARTAGRILSVLRREGESVVVGAPLYSISGAECFSISEEKKVAAASNLPDLVDGVARRESQLGLKLKGSECDIVASHAGILTKRNLESGSAFNGGDPLATIVDLRRMAIEIDIPERELSTVHVGQAVEIRLTSSPGQVYKSKIENVVPAIDPVTRTSKARLENIALPGHLSLEALVYGTVLTGLSQALLQVPSSALVFYHDQQFVIKQAAAGKDEAVPVQVVSESDRLSAVRSIKPDALKAGDLVAATGAIFLLEKIKDTGVLP